MLAVAISSAGVEIIVITRYQFSIIISDSDILYSAGAAVDVFVRMSSHSIAHIYVSILRENQDCSNSHKYNIHLCLV